MAFVKCCLNCESESRMQKVTLRLSANHSKAVDICTRCNEERKVEINDKTRFVCCLCHKVRQIVFRQACRQTHNCINCLLHENVLPEIGIVKNDEETKEEAKPAAKPAQKEQADVKAAKKEEVKLPANAPLKENAVAKQPINGVPVKKQNEAEIKKAVEPVLAAKKAEFKKNEAPIPLPDKIRKPKVLASLSKFVNHVEPITAIKQFQKSELAVGKILGEGSFKSAFKCDWNGTPVVKVSFHLENQDNNEANKNFREELQVIAKIAHPNIIQFLGRCKDEPAFVTSYCENGSLFDYLFRPDRRVLRGKITDEWRIRIALQVARAVNFLHHCEPPMIHRDLKSSNILLTEHLDAMITDFGLTLTKMKTTGITRHKGEGTVNYMSPESFIVNGPNISEKTDVWSYGCVFIELFGNAIPFREFEELEIGKRVTSQDESKYIPPEIEKVSNNSIKLLIKKCLRRDPAKRISFDQIITELSAL